MSDVMSIGRYQLENLFRAGIKFEYFLVTDTIEAAEHAATAGRLRTDLAAGSQPVAASEILPRLQDRKAAVDTPILLICEDGVKSKTVAQQLEQAGFMNVYRVEGGLAAK